MIRSFFDRTSSYGNPEWAEQFPGWRGSEVFKTMVEGEPSGGWAQRLSQFGLTGTDDRSNLARGMLGRVLEGWEAAKLQNPSLRLWDFMETQDPEGLMRAMSPSQRGVNDSRFTRPSRWGQRPY